MAAQRVLIVDDNKDAASSLGRLLTLLGHQTHVVHDGPAAVSAVSEFQPQVVFLDLGMPGMDGFETAAQMRAVPGGDRLNIVALTGWGGKGRSRANGASGLCRSSHQASQRRSVGERLERTTALGQHLICDFGRLLLRMIGA